ncbi:hypothetical protein CROQUDRAFT_665872 [Cronartium quercuum f. sp. fusiforme G11]|uniref:Uncharacterized protein n=1 Tax=Cronartium quercuum f. sp. fusiforme G11 TaxID=708437 RepID=A0A9P6T5I6_9BASI|nr:hypothetical protein CROQUDRAFT_665872 [Cronartium quercuum f. sp. fusiforme G11]
MFNSYLHSNGPAPAYAYESDSEDDEWTTDLNIPIPTLKRPSIEPIEPKFEWTIKPKPSPNQTIIFLLGQAAQLISNKLDTSLISSTLRLDNKPIAYYCSINYIVYLPTNVLLNLQHALASFLLNSFENFNSIKVVSCYAALNYLPVWKPSKSNPIPIRFLPIDNHKLGHGFQSFESPNLLQGLDSALILHAKMKRIKNIETYLIPTISKINKPMAMNEFDGMTHSILLIEDRDVRIHQLIKLLGLVVGHDNNNKTEIKELVLGLENWTKNENVGGGGDGSMSMYI